MPATNWSRESESDRHSRRPSFRRPPQPSRPNPPLRCQRRHLRLTRPSFCCHRPVRLCCLRRTTVPLKRFRVRHPVPAVLSRSLPSLRPRRPRPARRVGHPPARPFNRLTLLRTLARCCRPTGSESPARSAGPDTGNAGRVLTATGPACGSATGRSHTPAANAGHTTPCRRCLWSR